MVGRRKRERFEARFTAMNLANGGDDEIYNVMIDRLSRALEEGDIDDGMDDSGSSSNTNRERAHILLNQATSRLSNREQCPFSSAKAKVKTKSRSRQQTADWAKANAASIKPKGTDRGDGMKRSSQENRGIDESDTEDEINSTRALLEQAATQLREVEGSLEAGINNIIYSRLMEELGLKKTRPSTSNQAKQRAERRASAAANMLPTNQIDDSRSSNRSERQALSGAANQTDDSMSSRQSERRASAAAGMIPTNQIEEFRSRSSQRAERRATTMTMNPVDESKSCQGAERRAPAAAGVLPLNEIEEFKARSSQRAERSALASTGKIPTSHVDRTKAEQGAGKRASTAAAMLPTTQLGGSQTSVCARREFAASLLAGNANMESLFTKPPPLWVQSSLPSFSNVERRQSAMEILRNLKEKQNIVAPRRPSVPVSSTQSLNFARTAQAIAIPNTDSNFSNRSTASKASCPRKHGTDEPKRGPSKQRSDDRKEGKIRKPTK